MEKRVCPQSKLFTGERKSEHACMNSVRDCFSFTIWKTARLHCAPLPFPWGCVCVCFDVRYLTCLFLFPEEERHGCELSVRMMVSNMSWDDVVVLMLDVSCFPVAWARGRALHYPSGPERRRSCVWLLRRMNQSEWSACCLLVLLPALSGVHESAPWMPDTHQCCSAASFQQRSLLTVCDCALGDRGEEGVLGFSWLLERH